MTRSTGSRRAISGSWGALIVDSQLRMDSSMHVRRGTTSGVASLADRRPARERAAAGPGAAAKLSGASSAGDPGIVQQSGHPSSTARASIRTHATESERIDKYRIIREIGREPRPWSIWPRATTIPEPAGAQARALRRQGQGREGEVEPAGSSSSSRPSASCPGGWNHPNIIRIFDASIEPRRGLRGDGVLPRRTRSSATAASSVCCRCIARSGSSSSAAWRWITPTARASSIATSSRPISSSMITTT